MESTGGVDAWRAESTGHTSGSPQGRAGGGRKGQPRCNTRPPPLKDLGRGDGIPLAAERGTNAVAESPLYTARQCAFLLLLKANSLTSPIL